MKRLLTSVAIAGLLAGPAPAQDQSYRVIELEEQVRNLNGRVEELGFQVLQFEEKLRKMREEYEFRFQELEEAAEPKDSGSLDAPKETDTARAEPSEAADPGLGKPSSPAADAATGNPTDADTGERTAETERPQVGAPPRSLGRLTFDADGNLLGAEEGEAIARAEILANPEQPQPEPGTPAARDAATEYGDTPEAVLAAAARSGDPKRTERILAAHAAAWPQDPAHAQVLAMRGRALFEAKRYYAAADLMLDVNERFPQAETAPDALFTLAQSLAGLNQREVACATYAEVLRRHPQAAARLGDQVKAEQTSARC